MEKEPATVAETIRGLSDELTRAERQLADALMQNYPLAGLESITALAEKAQVSTPTVARLVKKLGFAGYPEFQASLRAELEATISSPIAKHERWAESAPEAHILNRVAEAVTANLRRSLTRIDIAGFDAAAERLADTDHDVFIVGGRITRALADYLFTHLQVIRGGLTLIASNANTWPHYLLNMEEGDVLVVFDIRRYERDMLRLVEMARDRGVVVILFTDQWGSPVSKHARHVFNCRIEAPSAWDSAVVTLFIVESLIAAVQNLRWEATRERIATLEELFDRTGMFRKFS
jgi:DNA-binding MurR/RpiR family transcriptional regulator